MEVHQMDFNSESYILNSDIDAWIYIKQPEGYVDTERKVCKLQKGLKQGGQIWNEKIDTLS